MDEKWVELANREIDGRNSPSESRALQEEVTRNAELAEYLAGLRQVAEAFQTSDEVDPPSDLKQRILEQARGAGMAKPGRGPLRRNAGKTGTLRRRRTALFIGGAAAVACALLLLSVIFPDKTHIDEQDLYGTLLREEGFSPEAAGRTVLTVEDESLTGEVKAAASGAAAVIDLLLQSKEKVEVRLTGSPNITLRGGLVREEEWESPEVYEDHAEVELPEGSSRLLFVVRSRSGALGPIGLRIASQDRVHVNEKIDFR
jgi:hypothetical protein